MKDSTISLAAVSFEAGYSKALGKVTEIEAQRKTDMNARLEGRVDRLTAQMAKLAGRIEAAPDHPKRADWKARWLRCQQSLKNIRDMGKETPSEAPVGVEIDVPAAPFSIKGA